MHCIAFVNLISMSGNVWDILKEQQETCLMQQQAITQTVFIIHITKSHIQMTDILIYTTLILCIIREHIFIFIFQFFHLNMINFKLKIAYIFVVVCFPSNDYVFFLKLWNSFVLLCCAAWTLISVEQKYVCWFPND